MTALKTCFKCRVEKSILEFYKHKAMSDGHLNKCKECTKKDVRKHRRENDSVREYDRKRGNRQNATYLKEYREKYPKKYKAHRIVNNAIRYGKMVSKSECEECSSNFHVEAHHDDYDKPMIVRWLCAVCHKRWHSEHGEGLNAV